jgi:hypothetical protein
VLGYLFQIEGHCKDANTVYISVQSILLEISGKGGRQKKGDRENKDLTVMKILRNLIIQSPDRSVL